MMAAESVFDAVSAITFGPAQTFRNLTLIPVIADDPVHADYLTLDEALGAKALRIEETSDAGSVPELRVLNDGDLAVLLLDGEELVGAKQNRVLNLSILVPPGSSITIPVSCVEHGRWSRRSARFASSPRVHYSEGRAARTRQVTNSLLTSSSRRSDQGAVWSDIDMKMSRLGAQSETSAMAAMYDELQQPIEDFVGAYQPVPGQVGAMFLVNGQPRGMDIFDAPVTWSKLVPKLVRSYALDALDRDREGAVPADSLTGSAVIDAVLSSKTAVFAAVGEGSDVRLTGSALAGAALVARGRTIHLSVFATH